jgi:serine/threonine protein kinase
MSPEQASSSGEDIDKRTDVYSLGIILYELLVSAPPIELRQSNSRNSAEIARGRTAQAEHQDFARRTLPRRRNQLGSVKPSRWRWPNRCAATWTRIALKAVEKDRIAPLRFPFPFDRRYRAIPEERSGTGSPAFGCLRARTLARRIARPWSPLLLSYWYFSRQLLSASGSAYAPTRKRHGPGV